MSVFAQAIAVFAGFATIAAVIFLIIGIFVPEPLSKKELQRRRFEEWRGKVLEVFNASDDLLMGDYHASETYSAGEMARCLGIYKHQALEILNAMHPQDLKRQRHPVYRNEYLYSLKEEER